jgi:hypothetical protein
VAARSISVCALLILLLFIMVPSGYKNAKTKKQIASEYGICIKTLNKWLKKEDIIIQRGLISPKSQEMIYEKLGVPKFS